MTPGPFRPGEPLRASDLDRVAGEAAAAQMPAAGFLSFQNGAETVVRNPRRARHARTPAVRPADVCPAVVRSGGAVPGVYNVMLHPNGIGRPGGGLATVSMTEFGVEHDLPSGTIILAHAIAVAAAEDGED